jgi:ribonuclease P protein component
VERRYRLRGRACLLAVREQGRRWVQPGVILGGRPNHIGTTRCAFIVSSKLGPATVRNRVRRRLREAVRLCYRHISPGWDLVWIARPPLLEADFRGIFAAVEGLLRQANLWQASQGSEHA